MLPPLESMEMGRVNQKDFEIFALHFVPGVIKAQAWKDCSKKQKFSNIVNESDEAIAFLILANNWDVWMDQCSNQSGGTTVKVRDTSSKQKYMEKDGGRGYSFNPAGRRYFNDRYDFALNDRDAHGEDFDNYLFQLLNKKVNHESSNCKKKSSRSQNQRLSVVTTGMEKQEKCWLKLRQTCIPCPAEMQWWFLMGIFHQHVFKGQWYCIDVCQYFLDPGNNESFAYLEVEKTRDVGVSFFW